MAVPDIAFVLNALVWGAWVVIWGLASRHASAAVEREGTSRYVHFALFIVAFALVIFPSAGVGWLGIGLFAGSPATAFAGLAVQLAGLAFAVWARAHLGENWSGQVTLKEHHELIRTGPYALARHPIYTGLLFGVLGSAIVAGETRGLVALGLLLVGFAFKIPREERVLREHFGEEYERYRREVRALVPFLF